jgi:hypothetical protein
MAPDRANLPAGHTPAAGVDEFDPAAHTYPALQLEQDGAPDTLNVPTGHSAAAGVDEFEPAGHA